MDDGGLGFVSAFAAANGCVVQGSFSESPLIELRVPLPPGYGEPFYAGILEGLGIEVPTVWSHQAEAMEALANGFNALLSTGTASGKSLIFQFAALRKIRDLGGRVLVMYPTRALNGDQTLSWRRMMDAAGYPPEALAIVDGNVPVVERMERLAAARVLLMTPDVVHAWLMSNLDAAPVRAFVAALRLTVLDEVHLYDGAFGTNVSYLLRRLRFAQRELNPSFLPGDHDQVVMASATLRDPGRFARNLVGMDAWVIDETQNTSPRHARHYHVIRAPDGLRRRRAVVAALLAALAPLPTGGTVLAFVDSRRAVDDMAQDVNATLRGERFAAYRSGLSVEDRVAIEGDLRSGRVRGVVSTSALEAGIDVHGVGTVVLDGVPANPASFRQRVGRLRSEGMVVVVAEAAALDAVGDVEAHMRSAPPMPTLYRNNPKIQAEQAVSFAREVEAIGGVDDLPVDAWPAGFVETVAAYRTKAIEELTPVQRAAVPPAGGNPHLFHGLRTMDGPTRRIGVYDPALGKSRAVGEVTQGQAIAEALPGMVVYARGRRYRVREWGSAPNSAIRVRPLDAAESAAAPRTRALVRTRCRTYLNAMRVMRGGMRFDPGAAGGPSFMAECKVTIERTAYGFVERRGREVVRWSYGRGDDLSGRKGKAGATWDVDPGFDPRVRYETTATVIRVGDGSLDRRGLRRLGALLVRALCAEAKVSQDDVGYVVDGLTVGVTGSVDVEGRTVMVYDRVPGSLLFSNKVYHFLPRVIDRMMAMVERGDGDMEAIVLAFAEWQARLRPARVPTYDEWLMRGVPRDRTGSQVEAYRPGSELMWAKDGTRRWVRVVGAEVAHGAFGYSVTPVSRDRGAFPVKGSAPRNARPAADVRRFARPGELERVEGRATYRLALFDLAANAYVGAPAPPGR